jgi:hypothetical protein
VKVEYAFESARARLYLPSIGETWFFVDQKTSMKEFKDKLILEDKHVKEVKFLDTNKREISNEETENLF